MFTSHRTALLGLVILVGACAKSQPDTARPSDGVSHTYGPTASSDRSYSVSGVYVDPELARTCGMSTPKAFFEFDSAALEGADNSGLTALAECLSTGPLKDRKLELVGHADPRGTDEYNTKLGKSRAQSVQEFLTSQGLPQDRMTTRSEGERQANEADAAEWPYDRRVDIKLVAE